MSWLLPALFSPVSFVPFSSSYCTANQRVVNCLFNLAKHYYLILKVFDFGVVCNDTVWFATYGVRNVFLQASRPRHVQPLC